MKTYNTMYQTIEQLNTFIDNHGLRKESNLLIQIFTKDKRSRVIELHQFLTERFPDACIIGATIDAFFCDEVMKEGTVVSFTAFQRTRPASISINLTKEMVGYDCGLKIGSQIISPDTKVLILIGTNHMPMHHSLLTAIEEHYPNVIVAGGNAVPLIDGEEYVITDDGILENGIAAVSLSGEHLRASLYASTEWNPVGRSFTVTKAEKERIYQLDGKPVQDIYQKYLGAGGLIGWKDSDIPFPLIIKRGTSKKPLPIKTLHEDGSITVFEDVEEGVSVQIGCGDARLLLNSFHFITEVLRKVPVEGLFMYSCLSRLRFFKKGIEYEMKAVNQLVPVSGAFTAGEYYHEDGKNEMLSYALTFLALAEDEVYLEESDVHHVANSNHELKELLALSQLIKSSTEDLDELHHHLKESEERYKSLFEHNPDIVYSVDIYGNLTSLNAAAEKLLGYSSEEVVGKNALEFLRTDESERVREYFKLALNNQPQHYTTVIKHKNGDMILFEVANMPIKVNDQVVGVYGVAKNRTDQILAEEKITQLAYHDSLTGLPNRLLFHEKLNALIANAKETGEAVAVMVIDLDGFKLLNDGLGHMAGDQILKQIAKNLSGALEKGQVLARFAADEFLILMPQANEFAEISALANKFLSIIKKPIYLRGKEYVVSASIGISLFPQSGEEDETLLKNANIALHQAKAAGRNSVQYFTDEMNQSVNERLELENHLRKAMQRNELELHYQPQIDVSTGEVFAFEALIRWNHTKRGMIPPNQFIPIAEEAGLINGIGSWVMKEACHQIQRLHHKGMDHLSVCVNVSGKQFQQPAFIEEVESCLEEAGLDAHHLHIELTESMMLEDVDHSLAIMNRLRDLGVKISVDDFGTGYSSLSYLREFPIDILKIDQSFIRNLKQSNPDAAIVRAIITMCEGLNMTVLAEGVETKDQLALLKEFGCNQIQGYYFSKPVKRVEMEPLIKKQNII
ncbi:EAL domain-containing protein [Pseudalkalibacillus sp. SCS-8]|uniref:EAL domain-containing protein n=1 Tax=Pseudalkalibacillus nanhaiensis TaxID=3115291 RepID=UPI0032D9AE62